MKYKRKITARERWVLALLPTVAISGIYLFLLYPGYAADLEQAQKRLDASSGPAPHVAPSISSEKSVVADLKRKIASDQTKIPQLEDYIATLHESQIAEEGDAAQVIQKLEDACVRDGVTPLISEPILDSKSKGPDALVSALVVDSTSDIGDGRQGPRVWHYVFNDRLERLQQAVKDMTVDNPTVVPLSMNLVYDPADNGKTRLLELWLLY